MAVLALHETRVAFDADPILDINRFVVERGETVALVGPSGAGKTTLIRVCNGTIIPNSGTVERPASRAAIGTVFQQLDLVGPLHVVHNVNAGRLGTWSTLRALRSLVRPIEVERARAALDSVGMAHKLYARTDRLSGGEQQRVALARVLMQSPEVILADEPVSSLDPARSSEVMQLFTSVAADGDRALVVSLHDFDLARRFCQRIVGLRFGRIVFDRPAAEVDDAMGTALYAS